LVQTIEREIIISNVGKELSFCELIHSSSLFLLSFLQHRLHALG